MLDAFYARMNFMYEISCSKGGSLSI
uniref:Uncharacterized protein n=1 Tax=Rhizophora mucronata TaxID=61149 RepID=A0A2P2PNE3_RHIMU